MRRVLILVLVMALATGCSATITTIDRHGRPGSAESPADALPGIRNVVLVLADDLDTGTFDAVPRLAALRAQGLSLTSMSVTESLCCPSRASVLRSQYVHSHQVVSNDGQTGGGWPAYRDRGLVADDLPAWLSSAGVRTALVGKYLNEFPSTPAEAHAIPGAWDVFVTPVSGHRSYTGVSYRLAVNGSVSRFGARKSDFLEDVLAQQASAFLATAASPFFLEVASFLPHDPAPVAARYSDAPVSTPRAVSVGQAVDGAPAWLAARAPLTPRQDARLATVRTARVRSAMALADTIDAVRAALRESGHEHDTLLLVTSDNGYHAGEHRLPRGKRTAFDHDTLVPFVAIGAGVAAGVSSPALASLIDLGPTIAEITGARVPDWVEGRSLAGLLATGRAPDPWRTGVLSESTGTTGPGDPDAGTLAPPSFVSMRTARWLFVEYVTGERELYDRVRDPGQLRNVASTTDPRILADLARRTRALQACSGAQCRVADAMPDR